MASAGRKEKRKREGVTYESTKRLKKTREVSTKISEMNADDSRLINILEQTKLPTVEKENDPFRPSEAEIACMMNNKLSWITGVRIPNSKWEGWKNVSGPVPKYQIQRVVNVREEKHATAYCLLYSKKYKQQYGIRLELLKGCKLETIMAKDDGNLPLPPLRQMGSRPDAESRAKFYAKCVSKHYKPGDIVLTLDGRLCNTAALIAHNIPPKSICIVENRWQTKMYQEVAIVGTKFQDVKIIGDDVFNFLCKYQKELQKLVGINLDFCGDLPSWVSKIPGMFPSLKVYALTRAMRKCKATFPTIDGFTRKKVKSKKVISFFYLRD